MGLYSDSTDYPLTPSLFENSPISLTEFGQFPIQADTMTDRIDTSMDHNPLPISSQQFSFHLNPQNSDNVNNVNGQRCLFSSTNELMPRFENRDIANTTIEIGRASCRERIENR